MLAFAIARRWPEVLCNAVRPGRVATRMGGPGASDDLQQGPVTQIWLAASNDPAALTTGGYFYHLKRRQPNPQTGDVALQEMLLGICREHSGVDMR